VKDGSLDLNRPETAGPNRVYKGTDLEMPPPTGSALAGSAGEHQMHLNNQKSTSLGYPNLFNA